MAPADRQILEFAAGHTVIEARQVATLLGEETVEAGGRLADLTKAGLVAGERACAEAPGYFRITAAGLRAIGSRLSVPQLRQRHEHALGVGWLWLAASADGLVQWTGCCRSGRCGRRMVWAGRRHRLMCGLASSAGAAVPSSGVRTR